MSKGRQIKVIKKGQDNVKSSETKQPKAVDEKKKANEAVRKLTEDWNIGSHGKLQQQNDGELFAKNFEIPKK